MYLNKTKKYRILLSVEASEKVNGLNKISAELGESVLSDVCARFLREGFDGGAEDLQRNFPKGNDFTNRTRYFITLDEGSKELLKDFARDTGLSPVAILEMTCEYYLANIF